MMTILAVRIAELSKGGLGKMKNTIKNDRRGRPTLSKLFWSQEDLDMLSAKCPPDNLPIDIENSYFKEKWNPRLSICMCNIWNITMLLRRPIVLKPCQHLRKNCEGRTKTRQNTLNVAVKFMKSPSMWCMKNL